MKPYPTALVFTSSLVGALALLSPSRSSSQGAPDDSSLAQSVAQGLIGACPLSDPGDEPARDRCADALAGFSLLRDASAEPVFWGAHAAGRGYEPQESTTTQFNPLVWRKMYLSLYMFPDSFRIETAGSYTLLRLPSRFRNRLDPGTYPYPFWHSSRKWTSYQRATEVILVFARGKLLGGYRSEEQDPSLQFVERKWDGRWRWTDGAGQELPLDSLYRWLFSPSNPHVGRLEAAYRALESAARPQNCVSCHSPDNRVRMKSLVLLNYPNQALSTRHELVTVLQRNLMPPADGGEDPAGIPDAGERRKLLDLAKAFAAAGDRALTFDQELKEPGATGDVNLNDAILTLKVIVGETSLSKDQQSALDSNGDGKIDVKDAVRLLRQAIGLGNG